jgi:CheY-like chemotaxis protein
MIIDWLDVPGQSVARMDRPSARPVILVVEDDDVVREFFTSALVEAGLEVVTVDRAQHAMEAVQRHRPDLIVLDLGMPRGTMQGQEFLAVLRESEVGRTLPVIILSAYGDMVNRDVVSRLGVAAVLSKPLLEVAQLVRAIRDHLAPSQS